MEDHKPKRRERGGKQKEQTTPDPFTAPAMPDNGDDDRETIFASVGRALSAWEDFESILARVFAHLVGGMTSSTVAQRAYGAVRTFESRADMVDTAAEAFLDFYQEGPTHTRQHKSERRSAHSSILRATKRVPSGTKSRMASWLHIPSSSCRPDCSVMPHLKPATYWVRQLTGRKDARSKACR